MPYQDGTFPSGSPVLTNAAGQTFKCNSFSINPAAETVNLQDENGAHSGALQFMGPITITAEVQYANNVVAALVPASVNSLTGVFVNVNVVNYAGGTSLGTVFITDVTTSRPQRAPWTASLTGQLRFNA